MECVCKESDRVAIALMQCNSSGLDTVVMVAADDVGDLVREALLHSLVLFFFFSSFHSAVLVALY